MKILMLHGTSDLYGSGRILLTAAEALVSSGHTVLLLLSEEGPLSVEMRKAGIEVRILRLGILRKKYFSVKGLLNRVIVLSKAYHSIQTIIKKEQYNLIYSNTTTVLVGAVVARLNGIKHIWHVHEMIVKPRFMYAFNGFFLQHFGLHIIAVSNPVKNHWLPYVDAATITVIHNGIETTAFEHTPGKLRQELGLAKDTILIGMIGRVNIFKGQEYFLEIAALLKDKYAQVHFILVGDAYRGYEYLYDKITGIITAKNLHSVVTDLRYREDIPNIMNSLDVLVLPSQFPDSFPTVILEAMAAGIPVVATAQGGALEMIADNETGYLIPLKDAQAAAIKLGKLIEDSSLRKNFGTNGKLRLQQWYHLDAFRQKIIAFVENT